VKSGVVLEHFPLHDETRKEIYKSWQQNRVGLFIGFITGNYQDSMQPLQLIANYYGEKMAFFYAYLLFYTSWLLIPAIPGLILFIYQCVLVAHQIKNG
jgi:hypothetical protein